MRHAQPRDYGVRIGRQQQQRAQRLRGADVTQGTRRLAPHDGIELLRGLYESTDAGCVAEHASAVAA